MGPSIEYFISGLELGNMVFMQYKTFPDGRREELPVQIIDVGIGLERIPWLVNGTPTSYCDVFPRSLEFFLGKLDCGINNDIWAKYGPYSCLLNVDEVEDLAKTWEWIAGKIGQPVAEVRPRCPFLPSLRFHFSCYLCLIDEAAWLPPVEIRVHHGGPTLCSVSQLA